MNSVPSQPLEPESRPLAESESLIEVIAAIENTTVPEVELLQAWAIAALETDQIPLAIKIVSPEEMAALNLQFAGKAKPTNVLSFPADPWDESLLSAMGSDDLNEQNDAVVQTLGDIAICADVVASEAQDQHKTLNAHWAHMVVHGVLHLRGFDHIVESEAVTMEAREINILDSLGFPNPYLPSPVSGDEANKNA